MFPRSRTKKKSRTLTVVLRYGHTNILHSQILDHKVIVTNPIGNKREVTFQGYTDSPIVWSVGSILKDVTFQYTAGNYQPLLSKESEYSPKLLSNVPDPQASSYDTVKVPILFQTTTLHSATGQQSTIYFGTDADFDRYGNPDFKIETNFDGTTVRRFEYKYAHRDGTADDLLFETNNFIHAVSNVTVFDTVGGKVSEDLLTYYSDPDYKQNFGLLKDTLTWLNENDPDCTFPNAGCSVRKTLIYDYIDRNIGPHPLREIDQIANEMDSGSDRNTYIYPSCNMVGDVWDDISNEAGNIFGSWVNNPVWLYLETYSSNDQTTSYSYDFDQRLTTISPPSGDSTSVIYNDTARRITVSQATASTIENYDARGRLTSREMKLTPSQTSYQTFGYDPLDNLVTQSERSLSSISSAFVTKTYDALNRVTSVQTTDGLTEYIYNGPDVTQRVHAEGGAVFDTLSTYDALGRLTSLTEPNGTRTEYEYDALDRLISVIQAANTGSPLTRSFAYSSRGKLLSETHPESGTTAYKYDLLGRITEKKYAGAAEPIRYSYDLRDRVLSIDYPNDPDVTYYYDGNFSSRPLPGFPSQIYQNPKSHLTGMIDETGTTIWPDFSNREELLARDIHLTGISNPLTLRYTYDTRGNLDSLQYPSGQVIRFGRNDANAISNLRRQFPGNPEIYIANSIDYNAALLPGLISFGNGVNLGISSDARNRPDVVSAAGKLTLDYRYNARGLIDQIGTSQNGSAFENRSITYDSLARLTSFGPASREVTYQYDHFGNLLSKSGEISAGPYSYTNNQLDSFSYSPSGNQLGTGGPTLLYDDDNRIREVTSLIPTTFYYDGKGNRVKSVSLASNDSRLFVYDEAGYLLSESTLKTGGIVLWQKDYVQGPSGTLATANYDEAPHEVMVSDTANSVRIQWSNNSNCRVEGFNIYKSTAPGGPYQKLNGFPVNGSFEDPSVSYCNQYYYQVRTAYSDASEGASSQEIPHRPAVLLLDENFNDGAANGFSLVAGTWTISSQQYSGVSPNNSWGISLSPTACNQCVTKVDAQARTQGKNAYVVFDYVNASNFKFAGFDVGVKKWIIGDVISGTRTDRATLTQNLQINHYYALEIKLDSVTRQVSLTADGVLKTSFVFASLNSSSIGLAMFKGQSLFDNMQIAQGSTPPGACTPSTEGPFTSYASAPLYFNLNDHLGTTRIVTNQIGNVTGSFEYYPFGEVKNITGCRPSDQQFTGKLFDADAQLQYFGARHLSNDLARFTSVDPARSSALLGNPQSWNRYAYSLNDPLNLIDPDGRVVILAGTKEQRQAALAAIAGSFHDPSAASRLSVGNDSRLAFNATDYEGDNPAVSNIVDAINSDKIVRFALEKTADTQKYDGGYTDADDSGNGNSSISMDPGAFPREVRGVYQDQDTAIQHEFGHANAYAKGKSDPARGNEGPAYDAENNARAYYRYAARARYGAGSPQAKDAEKKYVERKLP